MVDNMVDTTVVGGSCVVSVETVPGRENVVVMTSPGSVIVDKSVLTVVEMTVCVITAVCVGPGVSTVRVNVETNVVGGTTERLVTVITVPGNESVLT